MKVKNALLSLAIFFNTLSAFAQMPCLELDMKAPSANKGDIVCIPLTVKNFQMVVSLQFGIEYDPFVVMPTQIIYLNPRLPSLNTTAVFIDTVNKLIRLVWNTPNIFTGENLVDGDTLFVFCFKIIGEPGSCSPLRFYNKRFLPNEATDKNGDFICVTDLDPSDQIKVFQSQVLCVFGYACGTSTNSGSITIRAYGRQLPFTIDFPPNPPAILTNNGDTRVYNNLAPGTYRIRVYDGTGKDTILTLVVPITSSLQIQQNFQQSNDPTCWNKANGRINFSVRGGIKPYTIAWYPLNIYGDTVVNRLPVGQYTVFVRDSVGCEVSETFTLRADTLFTELIIEKQPGCDGAENGIINVCARGGSPYFDGYDFSWSQKGFNQRGTCSKFTMAKDSGFVIVTDRRGCQDTLFFKLTPGSTLYDSVLVDSVRCYGDSNGRVTVIMKSLDILNRPFAFMFYNAQNRLVLGGSNSQDTYISPRLKAGRYRIEAIDNVGCIFRDTFDVFQPDSLYIRLNAIDSTESCSPGKDGFIDISALGGTPNYSYNWSFPGSANSRFANLEAGSYTVTVTDAKNCTVLDTFNIVPPKSPRIDGFTVTPLICPNDKNACIEVNYTPGSAPIRSFRWNPANIGNTARVCGLGIGFYAVTITDQNDCFVTDTISIRADSLGISLDSFVIKPLKCHNAADAIIVLFPQGGTRPYRYNWNNGSTNQINADLKAGRYCVTISDMAGCPPKDTCFTIANPPPIEVVVDQTVNPSCATPPTCDGKAMARIMGFDTSYCLLFSSGEIFRSQTATAQNLCVGDNWVIGKDGTCQDTTYFKILPPLPISIDSPSIRITPPSCYNSQDGSISLRAKGGRAPYSYSWSHGATGPLAANLGEGTYLVTIRDSSHCIYTDSFRLRQPDSIRVVVIPGSTLDVSCFGKADGRITTAWTGGNRGRGTFIWSPNGGRDSVLTNLPPGTYRLEVVDEKGCRGFVDHTVNSPPPIAATYKPIDSLRCSSDKIDFTVLSAAGGNGPRYQWTINNGAPKQLGVEVPLFPGVYDIRVYDKNNCFIDTTIVITPARTTLSVSFPFERDTIRLGDSILLDGRIISSSQIDTVIWSPSVGIKTPNSSTSYAQPGQSTNYVLTVVDVNGCSATDAVTVIVESNRKLFISNALSANNDGINDALTIFAGHGVKAVRKIQVYDRWGNLIFEEKNAPVNNGYIYSWNGRYNQTGEAMNPGVYVYIIEVEFIDGFVFHYKGDITLLR